MTYRRHSLPWPVLALVLPFWATWVIIMLEIWLIIWVAAVCWRLLRFLLQLPAPRPRLDSQRLASPSQRAALWHSQHGRCAICGYPLAGMPADCDHITRWSAGGRTAISNLQLVHRFPCHAQKTLHDKRK